MKIRVLLILSAIYFISSGTNSTRAEDLSNDQALLELSFERGIDPYTLEEALQKLNDTEKKIQACLKKVDRKTCIGCCDASFGFLEPDKKRACKKRCHEQWPPDEINISSESLN